MSLFQKFTKYMINKQEANNDMKADYESSSNELLSGDLLQDIKKIQKIFERSSDMVFRGFKIGGKYRAVTFFLDGFADIDIINSDLLKPLLNYKEKGNKEENKRIQILDIHNCIKEVVSIANISTSSKFNEVVNHVLSGETVLFVEGVKEALFIIAKKTQTRPITEAKMEPVIRGPQDGFTEDIQTNITLIRRRIKSSRLKMEKLQVGRISQTIIIVTYIEGIVEEALVKEVKDRIALIDIDAVLESSYIDELIEDNHFSVFPQMGYTERPDKLASTLLEGHVGIIIDNTPVTLIAPQTFIQSMQSVDDYYERFIPSIMIRLVRYLFLGMALLLPSIYIALLSFHQGMIPKNLLITLWASREGIPFPVFVEAIIMEIFFEGLREAGVRLPSIAGQTVSIVGALVIGEAAVRAGIVSASMVIIVSITGIASFIIPRYNLALSIRVLRFAMMILSAVLGLYGIFLGIFAILIHMAKLRSFGVPYLSPLAPFELGSFKDVFIRAPRWAMITRPKFISKNNSKRIKNNK